ncbi:hypothetical protein HP456_22345, partial [Bacillus haikouensis]|uniref:hypothetical protein n=1 Tax=Bacillus haikouensis TaxID=1510468 RepID=UPI001551E07F
MTSKEYIKGTGIGIASGTLLGLILKFLQSLTGIKVYALLLNVDFIPYMGKVRWSEWEEFLFHLFISCIIGIIFTISIHHFNLSGRMIWALAFIVTLPAFLFYFPLSFMAIKEVPSPYDSGGIFLWLIGHLVYGVSL